MNPSTPPIFPVVARICYPLPVACTFDQADFGPPFSELPAEEFEMYLEIAVSLVLGPADCQAENEQKWLACCVDPCLAIKLVTKHLIASDPESDAGDKDSISERVGDVAIAYANISSGDNPFSDTTYGRQFGYLLRQYIRCRSKRRTYPTALRTDACGCSGSSRRGRGRR